MLLLSRLTGQQISTPDGRVVGRLADLTVQLDGVQLVQRLLVRLPDRSLALVAWDAVREFHPGRVVVDAAPGGARGGPPPLADDEILLARDVLDTQIVDVVGQRLARVADVLLARTPNGRLELCGVDVGFTGVLRRLGFRRLPASEDIVAWGDLHLTSERGHAVQLSTPRAAVHRLDARGLAALVSRVDVDTASEILAVRDPQVAADAVRAVHPEVAARIHRRSPLIGRRFFRSGVWPHRRRLLRGRRA